MNGMDFEALTVDRGQLAVGRLGDDDDMVGYWLTRTVGERLEAIELLRRTFYDYSEAAQGLQRVFEIAKLGGR